jgi:hypothetical protein
LEGRAAISNPPVTTSSAYCVATALTGTFSSLKLKELNPALGESRIYYAVGHNGKSQIASSAIDGSDVQQISTSTFDYEPAVSPSKIAFVSSRTGNNQIWIMNLDGTNPVQLTNTPAANSLPSIDLAGDKVVYKAESGPVFVVDVATKAVRQITPPAQGAVQTAVISPDGATVYFVSFDGTFYTLYKEAVAAVSPPVYVVQLQDGAESMSIAQDGSEVALTSNVPDTKIVRVSTFDGLSTDVDLPPGLIVGVSYSPDKTQFACCFEGSSDQTFFIKKMALAGGALQPITDPITVAGSPSWGPFTKEHILVATAGGMLGTHACGVIYGQQATRTTSIVAFDATTPSSVVMTAQTPTNSIAPNLVFSVDADNITKLAYTNSYAWRGIRIVGSGTTITSANGALVSLNAFDGTVVSILPFSGSRAVGSRPTVRDEGTTRIFTGDFLGVFDKDGKNLAPSGASTVKLDTKSNVLTIGS